MLPWIVLTLSVLGVVFGQFFYKRYSMTKDRRWLIIGLLLFCAAVPGNMIAARDLGIGKVYVGQSLSYILAPVLGMVFYKEPVARTQWKFFALIMLGIIIYAW